MKNQWRLLLLRNLTKSSFHSSTTRLQLNQVHLHSSLFSSFLPKNIHKNTLVPNPTTTYIFHNFSSQPSPEQTNEPNHLVLADILSKSTNNDEIKSGLESVSLSVSPAMVMTTLQGLKDNPEVAYKFFSFVLETQKECLDSKVYNLMFSILGRKEHVDRFLGLMDTMKRKGYRISKRMYIEANEVFEKEEMASVLHKVKELYGARAVDDSVEVECFSVVNLVRGNEWGEAMEEKVRDLNPEMVSKVLQHLEGKPGMAWKLFNFVWENENEKLSPPLCNQMLGILGRKGYREQFYSLIEMMRKKAYKISKRTYLKVSGNFKKEGMENDLGKLKKIYGSQPDEGSANTACSVICGLIRSENEWGEDLEKKLRDLNCITHGVILKVLDDLEGNPELAWKFFDFVLRTENEKLSSKSYNLMIGILGQKDYVSQLCSLMEIMKKKGYRMSRSMYLKVSKNFENEEMQNILDKLKDLYGSKHDENSVDRVCSRVCSLIRRNEWDEDVITELNDLNCSWSNDFVSKAVELLSAYPERAFMFFQWVAENPSFKHDKLSYCSILKVLCRADCIERFWQIANEMKEAGHQIDAELFILVMKQFYKKKMIKEAVDLYEFMMEGSNKPSAEDTVFLLHKIIMSENLDMDLFSRVLNIFTDAGNSLTKSIFDSVVNSLTTARKMSECGKVLKAMEKGGFRPTNEVYNGIILQLAGAGVSDEATEIIERMETSGHIPDSSTWNSLVRGQCVARDLEKASFSFRQMVERVGIIDTGSTFELLVNGFCQNKRAEDAYRLLIEMVDGANLRPLHTTYQTLIGSLLIEQQFSEALILLKLMKVNDYSPYLDPFIDHISKHGSENDAISFLSAVTDQNSPSISVFVNMFEAFFKAGRHHEAQKCLAQCPSYIHDNADVLNLFHGQRPEDASSLAA